MFVSEDEGECACLREGVRQGLCVCGGGGMGGWGDGVGGRSKRERATNEGCRKHRGLCDWKVVWLVAVTMDGSSMGKPIVSEDGSQLTGLVVARFAASVDCSSGARFLISIDGSSTPDLFLYLTHKRSSLVGPVSKSGSPMKFRFVSISKINSSVAAIVSVSSHGSSAGRLDPVSIVSSSPLDIVAVPT